MNLNKPDNRTAGLEFAMQRKAFLEEIEAYRKTLVEDAQRDGIRTVHIFNPCFPKGGLTVAFRKLRPNQPSTNMVEVAVATCSEADNFDRKTGTALAVQAFYNNETIILPLSNGRKDEDLNGRVKRQFEALYYTA